MISHRGVRENGVVENTDHAFAAAVKCGFRFLECDLRLTADHQIVLSHDPSFRRLTGDGRTILQMTRRQIENLRLADGQSPLFFDDFAKNFVSQNWVLDVKPETAGAVLNCLFRNVNSYGGEGAFSDKAALVLWSAKDAAKALELFPGISIYARESECWRAGLCVLATRGIGSAIRSGVTYSLPPTLWGRQLYTKQIAEAYHRRQAKLLAFLPRSSSEFQAAKEAGFDQILSDSWYQ